MTNTEKIEFRLSRIESAIVMLWCRQQAPVWRQDCPIKVGKFKLSSPEWNEYDDGGLSEEDQQAECDYYDALEGYPDK